MRKSTALLAALAFAAASEAAAEIQDLPATAPPSPHAVRNAAAEQGRLATVVALEAAWATLDESANLDPWRDVLATELTFVHDWETALRLDCAAYATTRPTGAGDPDPAGFAARDAVETILAQARGRRVVMLNEEHRRIQQRAFAHQLLASLAAEGFTHLALETLTRDVEAVAELGRRGHPLPSDGFYTKDPVLGDLVRRALELGLEVVNYEADTRQRPPEVSADPLAATNWREERQARNLAALVTEDPDARLIVWCGRHHLLEFVPGPGDQQWTPMGGIFARETGIDPLTVDLMVLCEADDPERERPVYRETVERLGLERATVLIDEQGAVFRTIDEVDLMVFLPRTRLVGGRPSWMAMGGVRRPHTFDLDGVEARPAAGRPLALEARIVGEASDAVPLDRVLWRDGEPPSVMLRPGHDYVLRLLAPGDEVLAEQRVDLTEARGAADEGQR